MLTLRRLLPVSALLVLGLALAACSEKSGPSAADQPLFGDGGNRGNVIVATVGDLAITSRDLDLAYQELIPRLQQKYDGAGGRQLLLKRMIDEVLLAQGALDRGLDKHPDVGRTIISSRRLALVESMRNIAIPEGHEPTEDDLMEFFKNNRKEFQMQPTILARHVECLTLERAQEAYQLLKRDHSSNNFMQVAANFSVNKKTLSQNAEVGWYNPSGVIPFISNSKTFINKTADLPIGLHPPIIVNDRWHVVEIMRKKPGRPMTFNESRDLVLNMMLPAYNDNLVKQYLKEARKTSDVKMMGEFAPGGGVSPEALMERADAVADPGARLDLYNLIVTDFPEHERADDALFLSAMVAIDTYVDRRMAEWYLDQLLADYPESDLLEDAKFLKENLYNPDGLVPQSIEKLRSQ